MFVRNTDQSHFAAQSARFLPNTTQATRITSAMYTGKSLTVKFCSTVHTAHSPQARGLWRHMLKYSTYPVQPDRTMGVHRELHCRRRTNHILIESDRETVWRDPCTFAENVHSGTVSTTLWGGTSIGNIFSILCRRILVWCLILLSKMAQILSTVTTSSVNAASFPLVATRLLCSMS